MVTDAVLWGLLAAAVAFIWLGCHNTRRAKTVSERAHDHAKFDRAA